ncbi:GDSL-type esterase/lipase family protein [Evansella sp. AB-P1]|uniref:GDSL-type esterase/lipase family protein n=1 Tax=Evansella sp. AB-P1 TaxID=3037653 RepID=UPI00241C7D28|nr:GDSL-type esterase/lipase family protein [Evansella sp. AB-P1]MDG5789823.1 GDSL-type esterase/lipase family protein [Evansella sp. AB-P1]
MIRKIYILTMLIIVASILISPIFYAEEWQEKSLVSLGDSITQGYNLNNPEDEAFPYLINDGNFQVTNLGIAGWTTFNLLSVLEENDKSYLDAIKKADVITLNIGNNDLIQALNLQDLINDPTTFNIYDISENVKAASDSMNDNLNEIISIIRSNTNAPIILYNIYNPMSLRENIVSEFIYYAIDEIILNVNQAIISPFDSTEDNIVVVDAHSAYHGNQSEFLLPYGDIHPNKIGQQVLADLANEALVTINELTEDEKDENSQFDGENSNVRTNSEYDDEMNEETEKEVMAQNVEDASSVKDINNEGVSEMSPLKGASEAETKVGKDRNIVNKTIEVVAFILIIFSILFIIYISWRLLKGSHK